MVVESLRWKDVGFQRVNKQGPNTSPSQAMYPPLPYPQIVSQDEIFPNDERLISSSPYALDTSESVFLGSLKTPGNIASYQSTDEIRDPFKRYDESDPSDTSFGDTSFGSADHDTQQQTPSTCSPAGLLPGLFSTSSPLLNLPDYPEVNWKLFLRDQSPSQADPSLCLGFVLVPINGTSNIETLS